MDLQSLIQTWEYEGDYRMPPYAIIEGWVMTKDLAASTEPKPMVYARTEEFIDVVAKKL